MSTRSGGELLTLAMRRSRRELRRARSHILGQAIVHHYLATAVVKKLQIGCGPNLLDSWLNTDRDPPDGAAYLDAKYRFPLPSATFDYVFSEHTIEHLSFEHGLAMLEECGRVLKRGGAIRLATPDLDRIRSLDERIEDSDGARYVRWSTRTFLPPGREPLASFVINQMFRGWGHRFIYDERTLRAALEQADFHQIEAFAVGESADEHLRGVESHGDADDREMISFETLVLEARRR